MSSVDDRIVNMKFNNSDFKSGAADTIKSLDGVDRAVANVGKNGSGGLTTMGTAVDGIKTKFSAMQVVGVAALGTIVSKATSAGLGLIKSLTLDPITQGFQEYQTNLDSIQTVVSNTGKSVGVVNQYMQKLNKFSDQTIYNFSEMAQNIGTFTAAGVDLEKSTASIQGIANLAALSGSSSAQASTAMYQLSQAIAAGRVSLQDWNSVVNAGMGGKIFQNALAQTSVAMGELDANAVSVTDKVTIMGKSFREAISGGNSFLTGDSLVNTLAALDGRFSRAALTANGYTTALEQNAQIQKSRNELEKQGVKYSDEQFKSLLKVADSAYLAATQIKTFPQLLQVVKESIGSIFSNAFSIILGNFNQSKALWGKVGEAITGPSGFITKMSNAITGPKGLLQTFVDLGGRTKVLSGLGHVFKQLGKIMGAVGAAFREVFPPASGEGLKNIAKSFNQFTRNLSISKGTVEDIKNIFAGFFAVLHIGVSILKGAFTLFSSLFGAIFSGSGEARGGLFDLAGGLGKLLVALDKFLTSGGRMQTFFAGLGTIIGNGIRPAVQLLGTLIGAVQDFFGPVQNGVDTTTSKLVQFGGGFSNLSQTATNALDKVKAAFSTLDFSNLTKSFSDLRGKITGAFKNLPSLSSVFAGLGSGAGQAIGSGADVVSGLISGIAAGLAAARPQIFAAVSQLGSSIIEGIKAVLGIHSPATTMVPVGVNVVLGIIQGIFQVMAKIGTFIGKAAGFLAQGFIDLFGGLDAIDWASIMNVIFTGAVLLSLKSLIDTLKGFTLSFNNIVGAVVGTFHQLTDTLETMQQAVKATIIRNIAIAVALLVLSIIALSLIDPKKAGNALTIIAITIALLVGAMKALSDIDSEFSLTYAAGAMVLMASAILILAAAIAILGNLDISTLVKGLTAMAIALGLMTASLFILTKVSGSLKGAAPTLLAVAIAINLLAGAIAIFGNMDLGTLTKGLTSMAIALQIMTTVLVALGTTVPAKQLYAAATAIVLISAAMVILAAAIAAFGNMDIGTLVKGFTAMGIALGLLVGAIYLISGAGPAALYAAGAMVLMAVALNAIVSVILLLGAAPWQTVATGLAFVAAALAILLVAAAAAMVVAPGLYALGITVGLLGAAMFLAGAGMLAFGTGFALLAAAGTAGVAVLIAGFSALMALLPTFALQIAAAFVSFIQVIAKASPKLRAAFGEIFKNLIGAVEDSIGPIKSLMNALIGAIIDVVRKNVPKYIEMGLTIVDKFLEGLAKHLPNVIDSAIALIVAFIDGIGNASSQIVKAGTNAIIKFIVGLGNSAGRLASTALSTILKFLQALDQSVQQNIRPIRDVGISIAKHIVEGLAGDLPGLLKSAISSAIDGLGGFASGLIKKVIPGGGSANKAAFGDPIGDAVNAALAGANAIIALDKVTGQFDETLRALADTMRKTASASTVAAGNADTASAIVDGEQAKLDKKQQAYDKIKDKAKIPKAKKDKAKKARDKAQKDVNKANNAKKKADIAAQQADDAATQAAARLDLAQTLKDADTQGKGDALAARSEDLANQSNDLLAKSKAEAAQAAQMQARGIKGYKDILAQSKRDAAQAKALADEAQQNSIAALKYYSDARAEAQAAVRERVANIRDSIQADIQARKDAADYEAADDAGKILIQQKRLAEAEQKRDAARAAAAAALADAEAKNNAGDTEAANAALDEAEKQAGIAQTAADAADTAADAIKQLQEGSGGGGSSGGSVAPSRSILEDAASAVDRYTASLSNASEAAAAGQGAVQYVQNIYSPEALSPSEVYRQSRNLIAAHEVKMGASNP